MIKRLPKQQEKLIPCLKTNSYEVGYQFFNYNINPPCPFGSPLCRESDMCDVIKCPYHNKNSD